MIETKKKQINIKDIIAFEPVLRSSDILFDPRRDISDADWKELRSLLHEEPERVCLRPASALAFLNKSAGRPEGIYASWFVNSLSGRMIEQSYSANLLSYATDLAYMRNISQKKADDIKASKHIAFEDVIRNTENIGVTLGNFVSLKLAYPDEKVEVPENNINLFKGILDRRIDQYARLGSDTVRSELLPEIFYIGSSLKLLAPERLEDVKMDGIWQDARAHLSMILDENFSLGDDSKIVIYSELAMHMTILAADKAEIGSNGIDLVMRGGKDPIEYENIPVPIRRRF